ncbi:phosphomannomutase/phosphoglucomutase [Candidatus Saccharibacteria bacterium]|nr:phosphomannomutase/phosphoglucomutase [Candidatus Saccharibacteria bacterium]
MAKSYKIVKDINPVIFRGYDIRGLVDEQLNEDVYYTFGRAYATWLNGRRINECTVGRDVRLTSYDYSRALIAGLNDGGINTIDLGETLTPISYFSNYEFKTRGAVMVTASHNPKEFNGLKLSTGYSETMLTHEIVAFRELCQKGEFVESKEKGENREVDILPTYIKTVNQYFNIPKSYKVVVDGCCTGSGKKYAEVLRKAGMEVIEQNCEPDGNFPMGQPDPTEQEVLERLGERVRKEKADIGFAYDTDGDRIAVVDENGRTLWMDVIIAIYVEDVLRRLPGAPIVFNVLCSQVVRDTILKEGGEPVMWITGHSFIKAKVLETRSPFGGELSGHIFFADNYFPHDDSANASLRLLDFMASENKTLSELVAELPQYISSPEIKLGLADDIKFELIGNDIKADLEKLWPEAEFTTIDGVRADLPGKMIVIRASQNGPYMTIKFEAKTEAEYEKIKKDLRGILEKYSEIDWKVGSNTHAI